MSGKVCLLLARAVLVRAGPETGTFVGPVRGYVRVGPPASDFEGARSVP